MGVRCGKMPTNQTWDCLSQMSDKWAVWVGFLEEVNAEPRPEGNKSGLEIESWEAPTAIGHRASGCNW